MSEPSERPHDQVPAVRLSPDDLVILNEEIAAMARAGLPLDQGLALLAHEMGHGRLQRVTRRLAEDLQRGRTLPEAMAEQGSNLPPYYASLVAAGVRSGRLGDVLATLTTYARTLADLRTAVWNALLYPIMILMLAIALMTFWIYFLGPKFAQIYDDFKLRMPMLTEVFFSVMRHPLLFVALPVGTVVGGFFLARFVLQRSEAGRAVWTRFLYSIPIVGTLLRSARLAAFTDLLAILVEHEVPLPEAFRLAGEASSDPLLREGSRHVEADLNSGRSLGESLGGRRLVPEFVSWMTGMGERRGRLGQTLHHAAALYRKQAEMRASLFRSVFPSFMILFTAVIVLGLFVVAMVLPMVNLLNGLSG